MTLNEALHLKKQQKVYTACDLEFEFAVLEKYTALEIKESLTSADIFGEMSAVVVGGDYDGEEVVFVASDITSGLILTKEECELAKQKDKLAQCGYCHGDEALFWADNENNAFIDSKGEMMVTAKDKTIRFKVKRCPMCGREFNEAEK